MTETLPPPIIWTDERGNRWRICGCTNPMHIHTPWRVREDNSPILPSDHKYKRPCLLRRILINSQCRICDCPEAWHE